MPAAIDVHEEQLEGYVKACELRPLPRLVDLQVATRFGPPKQFLSDSLLEFGPREKHRRIFATTLSLAFEVLVISFLLILPLMFTEVLPAQQLLTFLEAPPPPPPPPAAEAAARVMHQIQSDLLSGGQLRTPSRIPQKVQMIQEEDAPPPMPGMGGVVGGVPGGIPGGQLGGVIGGIISQTSSLNAVPKLSLPAAPKRVRVSQGVTQGLLIRKIEPKYPTLAVAARVSGEVVLQAIISKEGEIRELALVSGHPMLAPAAVEAVKQWRYRPFLLNGEPVEVETTVIVTFQLAQ